MAERYRRMMQSRALGYSQIELTGRQLGAGLIIEAGLRRWRP